MFSIIISLLLSLSIQAQYNNNNQGFYNPTWDQGNQPNRRSVVRGNLLSEDPSPLPYGSQIIVTLADVSLQDVPSRPLNTFVLSGAFRFPIPFEIPYSMAQVQADSNRIRQYAIQVRIEKDGQLLYINDQYIPVQLIPAPINQINILLKRVASTSLPGLFTSRTPSINGIHPCSQNAEIGPCKASILQYYFNSITRSCQIFYWGGCAGNQNRFGSREECDRSCSSYRRRLVMNNVKQRWLN